MTVYELIVLLLDEDMNARVTVGVDEEDYEIEEELDRARDSGWVQIRTKVV